MIPTMAPTENILEIFPEPTSKDSNFGGQGYFLQIAFLTDDFQTTQKKRKKKKKLSEIFFPKDIST